MPSSTLYKNIIFPGRHHLLTNFQHQYLSTISQKKTVEDINGEPIPLADKPNLIWAVTFANHSNTRRNPIAGDRREAAIEQFSVDLPVTNYVFLINDLGSTPRFADYMIKDIEVQSRGKLSLKPQDTVVACSTPDVIKLFEKLGYRILPVELVDRHKPTWSHPRPWDLVETIVEAGSKWRDNQTYRQQVHPASRQLLDKYWLGEQIIEVHTDPLLGDEGDITETRDYTTYRQAFEEGAKRKYDLVRRYIKPGRIVDIGCATGEIVRLMGDDDRLRESDLYGIEVARKLYELCERRKADGEFSNENTFFYQRNIMRGKLFADNSIHTTTTFSLTHEIESYIGRGALMDFIGQIYNQTAAGGVYINLDVVGPDNKDEEILLELSTADGDNEQQPYRQFDDTSKLRSYLGSLSTFSRFLRFARDFRAVEDDTISYKIKEVNGKPLIKLRLGDACEFLSKKDYVDSWPSEMHERFCFWNLKDWQEAIKSVGFKIDPDTNTFRNEWIIENRYKPAAKLWKQRGEKLEPVDFPVTNILIIARKTG